MIYDLILLLQDLLEDRAAGAKVQQSLPESEKDVSVSSLREYRRLKELGDSASELLGRMVAEHARYCEGE